MWLDLIGLLAGIPTWNLSWKRSISYCFIIIKISKFIIILIYNGDFWIISGWLLGFLHFELRHTNLICHPSCICILFKERDSWQANQGKYTHLCKQLHLENINLVLHGSNFWRQRDIGVALVPWACPISIWLPGSIRHKSFDPNVHISDDARSNSYEVAEPWTERQGTKTET